jgi:hypothetical protein
VKNADYNVALEIAQPLVNAGKNQMTNGLHMERRDNYFSH